MKVLGLIAALAVVSGLIFVLLNQDAVTEVRDVRVPGGMMRAPLIASILIASAAVVLLMLLANWIQEGLLRRALHRAIMRTAEREQEIATMKSSAYDDIAEKLDALRGEIERRLPSSTPPDQERAPVGPGVGG